MIVFMKIKTRIMFLYSLYLQLSKSNESFARKYTTNKT